jgi:nitrate reductase gamma subunit
MYSLGAVLAIVVIALIGGSIPFLQGIFGVLLPYVAFVIFLAGFCYKVMYWAKSPVPFRIPTTAGQQFSLPWIKQAKIENPSTLGGVLMRMFFEVFLFRSLFRNTKADLRSGYFIYGPTKWLWLFALLFHYSFLVIAIRHLRLFLDPVPGLVELMDKVDGMFQIGHPYMYLTDVFFILALLFLLGRRLFLSKVRFISLIADYFPLFLILGIGITGIMMRFWVRVDVVAIKALANGLVSFHPTVPDGISPLFFVHIALVSVLFAYFPFSKLMHMGGVFMSPPETLLTTTGWFIMRTHGANRPSSIVMKSMKMLTGI